MAVLMDVPPNDTLVGETVNFTCTFMDYLNNTAVGTFTPTVLSLLHDGELVATQSLVGDLPCRDVHVQDIIRDDHQVTFVMKIASVDKSGTYKCEAKVKHEYTNGTGNPKNAEFRKYSSETEVTFPSEYIIFWGIF